MEAQSWRHTTKILSGKSHIKLRDRIVNDTHQGPSLFLHTQTRWYVWPSPKPEISSLSDKVTEILTITLPTGPLRPRRPHPQCQIGSQPWQLSSCQLQEHPRDRTSHQRLETRACPAISRQRSGIEGGCAHETICWIYWTKCTRYADLKILFHCRRESIGVYGLLRAQYSLDGAARGRNLNKKPDSTSSSKSRENWTRKLTFQSLQAKHSVSQRPATPSSPLNSCSVSSRTPKPTPTPRDSTHPT